MRFYFLLIVILLGCSKNKNRHSEVAESRNARDYEILADSNYKADNFSSAVLGFTTLIALDSTNGEFFYKRGFSYSKLLEIEKSSNDFLKAIKFRYRPADSYYMLGLNNMMLRNDSLAVFYFEKSLELAPNVQETIDAMNACKKGMRPKKEIGI